MIEPNVHGTCEGRFEPVRRAFARNFAARDEIGAAVAVTHESVPVVDLWAGHADPERTRRWERDTLVQVYSTTKGMAALCAHRLADRGKLDLDAPVARYWPEFAAAGKAEIPVRWLLCHQSGVVALRAAQPPEQLYDWDAMCAALAAEPPWFPPGEHLAYEAVTFGWLIGEVVRRIDGRSLGRFFREEIAEPLGADFHIGLGSEEIARCADLTMLQPPEDLLTDAGDVDPFTTLPLIAFVNPTGTGDHNSDPHRRAEIPAINGHGTARSLARVYGALAVGGSLDGTQLLSGEASAALSVEHVAGVDEVQGIALRYGPGFMMNVPGEDSFTRSPRAFGHLGAGGSAGFADPDARLGFGYVCNRLGSRLDVDPRARALMDACEASLS